MTAVSGGTGNGFSEYRQLLLAENERFNENFLRIERSLSAIEKELASLKTEVKFKSGLWGALGAIVPICIAFIIFLITRGLG